jgi:hypothetical protein
MPQFRLCGCFWDTPLMGQLLGLRGEQGKISSTFREDRVGVAVVFALLNLTWVKRPSPKSFLEV